MTYTDNILYLRKKVSNYPSQSTKWLLNKIRNNDNKFIKITPSNLTIGKFYFMSYDLKSINKSSTFGALSSAVFLV